MACMAAIATASVAQNGTMTPYSRFGYGILRDQATSAQRAMGGVGYAMSSGRQVNVMNPAAYAAIDSLTFLFDMGIDLTALWSSETIDGKRNSHKDFGGGLDYATMQFPLGKYMGMSVGLLPYSSVGYAFGSKIENGIDSRQGSGSINELYVGLSGRLFKGFSIGANIAYMFGTLLNDSYAIVNSSGQSALFQREITVRDWHLTAGLQYGVDITPRNRITAGLIWSPGKTLLGHANTLTYDTSTESGPEINEEVKLRDNYSIPETWGAGLAYRWNNTLDIEFDVTYQPWSKAKYLGFDTDEARTEVFADRIKYALGLQYRPDARGSYFKRIQYRLGGYYNRDYLVVLGNNVREYGLTAGFGFPVAGFKTIVNLGLEWKHRQATPDPLLKEDYLNITIGVNFNEMWFRKSKIY